ncbi:MAG: hypothetical protein L6V95_15770 [Candidatus Melainabacteria bacterium]|nr:MAG: hypothetical protein L6V95_15770 [Candidatus Melainabacteria bacterium]
MGRLEELRINAYLSEVARGYHNNAFVAQNLFPTIYSEKKKLISLNLTKRLLICMTQKELSEQIQTLSRHKALKSILQL